MTNQSTDPAILLALIVERFAEHVLESHLAHGQIVLLVKSAALLDVARFIQEDPRLAFILPVDCTVVDRLDMQKTPRFEVIWHFYALSKGLRLRLKVHVAEAACECPSLTVLWPGMNWHEREAWDLYGIRFTDHPNLKRILMYEPFEGHPLRKDYPIDKRQPLVEMLPVAEVITQKNATSDMLNHP